MALKRVKANLEEWEKQIVHIESSKLRSSWFLPGSDVIENYDICFPFCQDKLLKHEVLKRDSKIAGLEATTEQHRSEISDLTRQNNSVSNQLVTTCVADTE